MFQRLRIWFARMVSGAPAPAYVLVRPAHLRHCPECGSGYGERDRYCPSCRSCVPEWRFG
jgi:hypothetical protein